MRSTKGPGRFRVRLWVIMSEQNVTLNTEWIHYNRFNSTLRLKGALMVTHNQRFESRMHCFLTAP